MCVDRMRAGAIESVSVEVCADGVQLAVASETFFLILIYHLSATNLFASNSRAFIVRYPMNSSDLYISLWVRCILIFGGFLLRRLAASEVRSQ